MRRGRIVGRFGSVTAAVVVPGARAVTAEWGKAHGLSLQTPVIVKYRDEKTDLATALEEWLR